MTSIKYSGSHPLAGSVALVTGSSRRIAKAIAMALAEPGSEVAVHARANRAEAGATPEDIRRPGVRSTTVLADVGDPEAAPNTIMDAIAALGRLYILVKDASSRGKRKLYTTGFEKWRQIMGIMLDGGFPLCRAAIPLLRASRTARTITTGGASGHLGATSHLHVTAAKSGLQGLTKAMAHYLRPYGITASMLLPKTDRGCG